MNDDRTPPLLTILLVALVSGAVGFVLAWSLASHVEAASPPSADPQGYPARPTLEAPHSLPVEDRRLGPPAVQWAAPSAAIRGTATWYCGHGSACTRGYGPADLVAAIDPTLGIHRGELLTVTAGRRSVTVRVVDVCACAGRRVIDLTSGAFRRLAPLSRGTVAVTLTLGRALPPTDTP